MKRKVVLLALVAAAAAVLWQNYPDLVRYLKISRMSAPSDRYRSCPAALRP
ncbi:DUF6893 family small protein [Mycobacterium sp.]|uniref:DUF6893 family small protein n=1 Tax=Mycobacterium sp. TaxID=1785 RepID=UPI002B827E73|nr:hypothetical protein [Mycobacterium sp.]HME48241.1 hypothetical protein [Mycobacterium sp.]